MPKKIKAKRRKRRSRHFRRGQYSLDKVNIFENDEHHTKFSLKELIVMIVLEASIFVYFMRLFWGAPLSVQKTIMHYQWAKWNMVFALIILVVLGYNMWGSSQASVSSVHRGLYHEHVHPHKTETLSGSNDEKPESNAHHGTNKSDQKQECCQNNEAKTNEDRHDCDEEEDEEDEHEENDSDSDKSEQHRSALKNVSESYKLKLQQLQQDYSNIEAELEKERNVRATLEEQLKQKQPEKSRNNDDLSLQISEIIKSQKETLLSKMKKAHLNLADDNLEDNKIDADTNQESDANKKTHGQLREEIIKRQFAPNARSRFPNAKDLICLFEDMRTNSHTHLHYFVFVMLEKHCDMSKIDDRQALSKSLLRQSCQWLWDMLMDCYSEMLDYEADIYQNIGHALCIQNTKENGLHGNEELSTTKSNIPKLPPKKKEALKFTIGHYLQQNYESLLHAPAPTDDSKSKLTLTVSKMVGNYLQKMQFSNRLNDQENEQLKELMEDYLKYACEICWLMVLQDITMSLSPTEFQPKEIVTFDEKLHIRYFGSENVPQVAYYVWPAVKRGDTLFDTLPFVVTGYPIE